MSIHVALNHVTHYRYDRRVTPVAAGRAAAAGAALPHADPVATRCASSRPSTSSTGSRTRSPTTWRGWSSPRRPPSSRSPSTWSPRWRSTTRSTSSSSRAPSSSRSATTPSWRTTWRRISCQGRGDAALRAAAGEHRPRKQQRTIDFLVARQPAPAARHPLPDPHGAGRADARAARSSTAAGSCRDTGWLLVQLLRHLGLAARFVSGYLIQLKPDVKALDGPSGTEVDFTDLHAWCEVYLPGAGWIGLDPTSGLLAGEGHIPVACTPEPSSAAPVSGAVDDSEVEFAHHMRDHAHLRIAARHASRTPRRSGRRSLTLGHAGRRASCRPGRAADDGRRADLRLGRRPRRRGVEHRRARARPSAASRNDLVQRLRERYGAGGFLHFGQGKWYPGEQLPRWALVVVLARRRPAVLERPGAVRRRARAGSTTPTPTPSASSTRLTRASRLDGRVTCSRPTRTPGTTCGASAGCRSTSIRSTRASTTSSSARACAACSTRAWRTPSATLLPLKRDEAPGARRAALDHGPWFLRDERMYLMPGDSPMGYRLPLDSLPWVTQGRLPLPDRARPVRAAQPLPAPRHRARSTRRTRWARAAEARGAQAGRAAPSGVRHADGDRCRGRRGDCTPQPRRGAGASRHAGSCRRRLRAAAALRVGALDHAHRAVRRGARPAARQRARRPRRSRQGGKQRRALRLHAAAGTSSSDYLELLAAVEATAAELGVKIVLEGYPPPRDPRLKMLQVTPDPGVIEVNIHPAHDWAELVDHTEFLYEAAHQHAPVDREVHARRPPHRHRRRQPLRARRRDAGRQPVPAPARPAGAACWPTGTTTRR